MSQNIGIKHIGKIKGFAQRTFDAVDQTPFLPEIENLNLWRSPVNQRYIKQDLEEFVLKSHTKPKSNTLDLAIHRAYDQFRLPEKVKMLHLNDVFQQDLDIWSKSPGLPWRDCGYKTKDDIRKDPEAVRRVRKFAHLVKGGEDIHFPDCLAYVRSHTCERGQYKVRAVWGYPATISFMEAVFAIPLIRGYQARPEEYRPIAYGFETATGGMKRLVKRFRGEGFYTGLDFRKFDKTVPPWLIEIAFDILLLNIDIVNYAEHGTADARRMVNMFYALRKYFIATTIRTSDGHRYRKYSGIASGSYFTQLIGSIVNCILINWLSLEQFGSFPEESIFLGDDSLTRSFRKWDLDFCNKFLSQIGMEINLEKSGQTTELKSIRFLGYRIGDGEPNKDLSEWMVALLYPERPDKEFSDVQNRALGLYYANMCVDIEFARICHSIIHLRPFDVKFSSNFERMLRHIGINLSAIDPHNLPSPLYFAKTFM